MKQAIEKLIEEYKKKSRRLDEKARVSLDKSDRESAIEYYYQMATLEDVIEDLEAIINV